MKANLVARGDPPATVWVSDSFQGLPRRTKSYIPPTRRRPSHAGRPERRCRQVRHNFERYGVLDDQVKFLVGWFKDTLPNAPIDRSRSCASTATCTSRPGRRSRPFTPSSPRGLLHHRRLREPPVPGRAGGHDYRRANGIDEEIVDIDGFGAYWRRRW